ADDIYYGPLPPRAAAVMREVCEVLEDLGATLVHANIPTTEWTRDCGIEGTVLKLYPGSLTRYQREQCSVLCLLELKQGLNAYLRDWAKGTSMRTLADIIAFNAANADRALRFGQEIFVAAEQSWGSADMVAHITERCMDIRAMHA